MEKKEKDQILKETFIAAPSTESQGEPEKPQPQPETLATSLLKSEPMPMMRETAALESLLPTTPFPTDELLTSNQTLSFTLPAEERMNLFEHLPKDLIIPSPPRQMSLTPILPPTPLATHIILESTSPSAPPEAPALAVRASEPPLITSTLSENSLLPKTPSFLPAPSLPKLPSLSDLETTSYSEYFDAELVFSPREDGGAIFALTLIPRHDLNLTPIRQNYFFLIDKSNSIQGDRLATTKSAIQKAIEEIDGDDTFNIIAFDSKMEKAFPSSVRLTADSIRKAKEFLEKIELGSFFSQADLFKPLFLTIPSVVKEDELYTAVLLTDGENLSRKGTSHSILNDWTRYNDGRVSLFAVALGGDNQLSTLDTASAFNRGKVFSSPTKRGIKRKLLKLMKTIHAPVAKNLSCRGIARAPKAKVEIFPKGPLAPHLYLNEPYVIVGETDSMDDFILFVQGRINGEWLHIKKSISFINGKKGGSSLKAEWALQKAYELYDRYLSDGNSKHIAEARKLLEPHDLRSPFE